MRQRMTRHTMTSKEFIAKREAEIVQFASIPQPLTERERALVNMAHAFGIQTWMLSETEVTEVEK